MQVKAGKNRTDYKKNNRGQVLKLIATGTCKNRTELTKAMGLSKMAISRITGELMDMDLIEETFGEGTDEPGRNPASLMIASGAPLVAGLLIQREFCEGVLCDLELGIRRREKIFFDQEMNKDKLLKYIYRIMDTLLYDQDNVLGIGVSSVGPVSASRGMILKPFYFFGISDVPIVELLNTRYHLPVFLDHDNQLAAVCEFFYGTGRGYQDILYLGIGSGIGSGIISNGQRYRNKRGLPPEIGHVSININGKRCQCGSRGCVEIDTRTPEVLKRLQYHSGKLYSYQTYCSMKDDPVVEQLMNETVMNLGAAVVSTINILNSELLILGNDAVYWDDRYVRQMEELINERRFVEWSDPVEVRKALYRQDSILLGSACGVLEQIFDGHLLFED